LQVSQLHSHLRLLIITWDTGDELYFVGHWLAGNLEIRRKGKMGGCKKLKKLLLRSYFLQLLVLAVGWRAILLFWRVSLKHGVVKSINIKV
jgi:hypothetical protein